VPDRDVRAPELADFARYRVEPGDEVSLADHDPGDTGGYAGEDDAGAELGGLVRHIANMQERLYAEERRAVLVVLQGTDAAGKDSTIKHVFRETNPQGCRVYSFKQPSMEESAHDFLWRYHPHAPAAGMIHVFNRSHYEDVLVVRVKDLVPEPVWRSRYDSINDFERMLVREGTTILKFFLHISKDEQARKFKERLERDDKHWKFSASDVRERRHWDEYRHAYEDALECTSTPWAPWWVVPADHRWYRNLVVARIIGAALDALDPRYPETDPDELQEAGELPSGL
jgi:PPK2 family polyphosphate:nucleotide phosphotransferase